MEKFNIQCHHDINRFLSDVKEFDVSRNPYLSYAYLAVYFKYFSKGNFFFYNITKGRDLCAIIPFECTFESKLFKLIKFRFIGYRQFNYEQYICQDNDMMEVHEVFMNYLKGLPCSVVMNYYDINNTSPLFKPLKETDSQKTVLSLYCCPCLHFADDFEVFFKTVFTSSKKRAELKKFQKRVSELGTFSMINIDDANSYQRNIHYIDQIYKVHAERFSGVYATSFFGSEKMRPFYSELIKSLMYGKKGHLSLLVLDDIVIAFVFCLTNGEVLIDWIPAFDPAFSKYSLGIVQYKMLFEEICNNKKYKVFDYSKGASVYKSKWAKEETTNFQILINLSSWNPVAFFAYYYDKFKFSFKVYLRNKGVLNWVKQILGKILSSKEKKVAFSVEYESDHVGDYYIFDYKEIHNLPVQLREIVLNSLYQGKKIIRVSEKGVVLASE